MDDYVIVTFDGNHGGDWYVADTSVEYLTSELVNRGSGTIYLYPAIRSGNNTEYISISSMSLPVYHSSSSSTGSYITNVSNVRFNSRGNFIREFDIVLISLLGLIALLGLIRTFLRR